MKLRRLLIVIYSLCFVVGCQSTQVSTGGTISVESSSLAQNSLNSSQSPAGPQSWVRDTGPLTPREAPQRQEPAPEEVLPDDLWQRIGSELSWQAIENDQVDRALASYLAQHSYMPTVSERGSLFLYYIVEEVQKRNMPMEIVLLPLVESTLDPMAYSRRGAAGLWQIMPATGTHLGLQQDWWFDGRRSVRDSTRVALDYLEQLHRKFDNDWLLALAAYNAGNGRIVRAQRANAAKGLPTDYWSLSLPRETRRYVPKMLALSRIVADPQAYDVIIPPVANAPAFEVAEIGGQIELARAAELAEVSLETLRWLNAGQLRWATSPDRAPELLVPLGTGARLEEGVAQLSTAERVRWRHYTVKSGDNLIGIAKKFDTQVGLLRRVNSINGSMIRTGSSLMIPGSEWAAGLASSELAPASPIGYKVRRGDSLYDIAGKYSVSVDDIVAWNALDPGKYLQPGQTLKLHVRGL
jgi:membrane-bound lytic murein transglycosylase D